jgi:hypothetical protein
LLAQVVDATVDVGVLLGVESGDGIDDSLGLLAGGRVIEINQRLSTNLLAEDREIGANALDIKGESG